MDLRLSQLLEENLWGQIHCKVLKCSRSRENKIAKRRKRFLQSSYHSGHQLCMNLSPCSSGGFPAAAGPWWSSAASRWAQEVCHLVPAGNMLGRCKNLGQNQHSLQALCHRKQGAEMFMLLPVLCSLATPHTFPPGVSNVSVTWWALNIFYASQCWIELYY